MIAVRHAVALLALSLLLGGCSRMDQVKRCAKLSKTVNGALDEIEGMQKQDPRGARAYLSISKRYAALATELKSLDAGRALEQPLNEYVGLLESAARSSDALGHALEEKDLMKISEAARELSSVTRREKFVVQRIDGACHAG